MFKESEINFETRFRFRFLIASVISMGFRVQKSFHEKSVTRGTTIFNKTSSLALEPSKHPRQLFESRTNIFH